MATTVNDEKNTSHEIKQSDANSFITNQTGVFPSQSIDLMVRECFGFVAQELAPTQLITKFQKLISR